MRKQSKAKAEERLYAVCDGECIPLSEVPDEVFSSGMLGQGVAFVPVGEEFVSPVEGIVVTVAQTAHAYSICAASGAELLVHIGVDTVRLNGEGMTPLVKEGERVSVGTPLARVRLSLLEEKGVSPVTSLLVSSETEPHACTFFYGNVRAGEHVVMRLQPSAEVRR